MFDSYALRARYYPMIIVFSPIIAFGFFYSLHFNSISNLLVSAGLTGALTYLFSQLGRDQGKRHEAFLWQSWGGIPSIQILRLNDNRLDPITKQRYHQKLMSLCPVPEIPIRGMEKFDSTYHAWTKYLISQTRDKKKFPLLFKENISYGFRRNLYGLKPFAIIFTLFLMTLNYFFWVYKSNTFNLSLFPQSFIYSTISALIIILFWLFIVTKVWVKVVAFAYAERLVECVEIL